MHSQNINEEHYHTSREMAPQCQCQCYRSVDRRDCLRCSLCLTKEPRR